MRFLAKSEQLNLYNDACSSLVQKEINSLNREDCTTKKTIAKKKCEGTYLVNG